MSNIHPLAFVSPEAQLGENVEIGPYAYIDKDVVIGDNCKIHPHAVIYSYVRMGEGCEVFPGAVVGAATTSPSASAPRSTAAPTPAARA